MKKNTLLLSLMAVSVLIFSACSEDEDEPQPSGPNYAEVNTYTARLLGGQSNSTLGSFYSTSEDSVYFTSRAAEKQEMIDFIFYFGGQSTDSSTIASPSDVVFQNPNETNPHPSVRGWIQNNATTFKATPFSASQFINTLNDSLIIQGYDSTLTTSLTKTTRLKAGEVYAFKTQAGKKGLFHVSAISGDAATNRAVTINVKVQK